MHICSAVVVFFALDHVTFSFNFFLCSYLISPKMGN